MKKIETLTQEQKDLLPVYAEKWTKIGLSTQPADRALAEEGINESYKIAGLALPEKIIWCGSPLSMCLTHAILKNPEIANKLPKEALALVSKKVGASVWDSVGASVWDSVGASVGASVWDSVRDSVLDSVWDSVGASVRDSVVASVRDSVLDSVRDSVWNSVWASVRDSVWASVLDSVRDSVWNSVWASVYGQHDAEWLGFYDYFMQECGLHDQTNKLTGLWKVAKSANWWLPCQKICFVSERAQIVKQDDQKRLHAENGPAVKYPDGFTIHCWHGTKIPAEWVEDKSCLTPKIALGQENTEMRRAACDILGWANVLEHPSLNPKVIDKDLPHIGELIEVDLPDAKGQRFLKVKCGTGRLFALAINDKKYNTALHANAALGGWRHESKEDPMNFIPMFRS